MGVESGVVRNLIVRAILHGMNRVSHRKYISHMQPELALGNFCTGSSLKDRSPVMCVMNLLPI